MLPDEISPLPQNEVPNAEPPAPITVVDRLDDFIRMLQAGCRPTEAADACGLGRTTVYRHRRTDAAFAERWNAAIHDQGRIDALIAEAKRRALRGSDRLLEFLLCNLDPEHFSKREKLEVSGGLDIAERLAAGRRRLGQQAEPNPEDFI